MINGITELDEKILDVIRFVINRKEITSSRLQMKYLCGYNRTKNIIKQLVQLKIIESITFYKYKIIINKNDADIIIKTIEDEWCICNKYYLPCCLRDGKCKKN